MKYFVECILETRDYLSLLDLILGLYYHLIPCSHRSLSSSQHSRRKYQQLRDVNTGNVGAPLTLTCSSFFIILMSNAQQLISFS